MEGLKIHPVGNENHAFFWVAFLDQLGFPAIDGDHGIRTLEQRAGTQQPAERLSPIQCWTRETGERFPTISGECERLAVERHDEWQVTSVSDGTRHCC